MKLARLELSQGSSRGSWLIRDFPGLLLIGKREGWLVVAVQPASFVPVWIARSAEEVWGKGYDHEKAQALMEANPRLGRPFRTRGEAVSAVVFAMAPESDPVLGDELLR